LKNGFTKFILKNIKKKSIFLKPKQTHPSLHMVIDYNGSDTKTMLSNIAHGGVKVDRGGCNSKYQS
jgi:hypothetical protein